MADIGILYFMDDIDRVETIFSHAASAVGMGIDEAYDENCYNLLREDVSKLKIHNFQSIAKFEDVKMNPVGFGCKILDDFSDHLAKMCITKDTLDTYKDVYEDIMDDLLQFIPRNSNSVSGAHFPFKLCVKSKSCKEDKGIDGMFIFIAVGSMKLDYAIKKKKMIGRDKYKYKLDYEFTAVTFVWDLQQNKILN